MDYLTYTKRLEYLLELIEKEQVNSPNQVAIMFECSEKTIRNMINCLRRRGNNVKYCKCSRKYFLEN